MAYSGKFILIVGPTGAGKGTLVAKAREKYTNILFPNSYTTRSMRQGEVNGEVYNFISLEQFDEHIANNDFLEWAEFDGGKKYGTLKADIIPALSAGKCVMKEVEVQGATKILSSLPRENILIIFIEVDSWDDLERRVKARAPMTDEELALRKARFEKEILFKEHADYSIYNHFGEQQKALDEFFGTIDLILDSFSFV